MKGCHASTVDVPSMTNPPAMRSSDTQPVGELVVKEGIEDEEPAKAEPVAAEAEGEVTKQHSKLGSK